MSCEIVLLWRALISGRDLKKNHTRATPLPPRARPQKQVPDAIMTYVIEKMEQKYVEPPPFHLPSCYEDSTCTTPLIFVLNKGSDPTKSFLQFASELKFDKKLR